MANRILVTGGCGFVGSNLVAQLVKSGNSVRVLDNLVRGRLEYLDGLDVEIVNADVTSVADCELAFDGIETVVHLAALGSVVESVANPVDNFQMNVVGTFNVLNLSIQAGVEKLIFSSTGGALIGNAVPPVSESSLPKPISPYGASKLCCEAYCHAFAESYDLKVACLRFANVYGENSLHKTGVINKFVQQLMKAEPLTIYGDGSSTRDYIHVSDLCAGIELAINNDSIRNDIFHIATGKETSLRQLADIFLELGGFDDSLLQFKPSRVGEVERNFAYFDLAKETLGYEPRVALKDGMSRTYKYLVDAYSS